MELRHLRYFVAVAEAGSFTVAATQTLHTAQPSLSRQIRDLEDQVGVPLLVRNARGIALTPAGKVFFDHAKLALAQVQTAVEAARRAARPSKPSFALGFLTGQEMDWLPEAMRLLRDELPRIDVTVSSQYSPELADALVRGKLDIAFMRHEPDRPDLAFKLLVREPLVVVLPSDHALAAKASIDPQDLVGETLVSVSNTAPALRAVIDRYLKQQGVDAVPAHEADNLAMAISLVASTRGIALLPVYAKNFLPWSVVSRPIEGEAPTIDLVIGYRKADAKAGAGADSDSDAARLLQLFLSRIAELGSRSRPGSPAA